MRYLLIAVLLLFSADNQIIKPTIFLIGDSTVKNGSGKGEGGLWGWGDFLYESFDTTKIRIANHARGGRSSRTYLAEGLWDEVLKKVKPGDYVIMQFGHNDRGAVNDTIRARGTIKGIGDETQEIDNLITKKHEIVHSYGWYMKKYIRDTKSKGAVAIICSPVARNQWKADKAERAFDDYAAWCAAIAKSESAFYIDLNERVASRYEKIGPSDVKSKLFLKDDVHTTEAGAKINASIVADALKKQRELKLKKYMR